MKNIKEKKCKNCKGRGFVPMGEGMKGLTQCPVCLGSGEELLAEEMEKQWIANYDFERGDVKY